MRSRALFVLSAVALSVALAKPSAADGVPQGWDRNDYIAYLTLSDLLGELTKDGDDVFIACISNEIGVSAQGGPADVHDDPSPHLMAALIERFASHGRHVPLRLASECHEVPGRVEEQATGKAAMYVYAALATLNTETCGPYESGWHHAGLWGGANFYKLDLSGTPLSIKRGNCVLME